MMKWSEFIDEKNIRKTIEVLKPNNELFEVRVIGKGAKKRIISGYFKDVETLIKAFDTIDPRQTNIYLTINKVNEACYSREQRDCFRITDASTHDHEVDMYEWLFIDLDPVRLAEVSSSDEELKAAISLSDKVYSYMKDLGFSEPVRALSGNGAHLLYRINLENNEENKNLVERCLIVLSSLFNNEKVKIDEVNHNQSRVCKLYGTLAQKGANTAVRPHRMSRISSIPSEIKVNSREMLETLASELPEVTNPPKVSKNNGTFVLEDWMFAHGLEPISSDQGTGCTIYPLANCPFDHSHTNGDSKIFKYNDGAIAFKCHHNSCRGKKWQDVRELLEPGAYSHEDDERIDAGWKEHKKHIQYKTVVTSENIEEIKKNLPKLSAISAFDLQNKEFGERYYAVENLIPVGETVVAAPPKTGKSWLMLDMCLKIAEGKPFLGFPTKQSDTLYLALEDGDSFEQERLNIITREEEAPKNFHFVFSDVMPMNEGFLLQLEDLLQTFPNVKVVVIDTLQLICYRRTKAADSAYETDYRTGRDLKNFADEHNISIVVVTHTTKMLHAEDEMANVSGTNGVTGAADAIVVLNKKNRMDKDATLFIVGRRVRQSLHNVHFNDQSCIWEYIGVADPSTNNEQADREAEYFDSDIREAVVKIANNISEPIKIRANQLVEMALKYDIGIKESNKMIGGFLSNMMGMFKSVDDVKVEILKNGTGARCYIIHPTFVLDKENEAPFME